MLHQSLNGIWSMRLGQRTALQGKIPGSVYSIMLKNQAMEDPFFRDNEWDALKLMEDDSLFTCRFEANPELFSADLVLLHCDGLDTICTLTLNGTEIGKAENFHRVWEYDVTSALKKGENVLEIAIASPTRFIAMKDQEWHVGGSTDAMRGFPHMRKPHCMFGWDWGPHLPDMGIWRNIELLGIQKARIEDIVIQQFHENGTVSLQVSVPVQESMEVTATLTAPDGSISSFPVNRPARVENPKLWWPNGLGDQPLYTVSVALMNEGVEIDRVQRRVGLRTFTMSRQKDKWGEEFAPMVNGVKFFAMGADYIPEDNVFSRITPERTRKLLEQCKLAHFNMVRVWGGGCYPNDNFFDSCDELGLMIWQDFMFACANYPLDDDFEENIAAEVRDNVRRLRHHPSLALWCANNEIEEFEITGHFESNEITRGHYIRIFEHIIPHVLKKEDPSTFFWPSSPSSGGSFDYPTDPNRGDVHYWDVWHGGKPFHVYRQFFFRYVSEFGFQSFPENKTVNSFTLPEDRNIFSRIMEMHQRNAGANGKILQYLSQTYLYPTSFDALLYASQLLQADAIRYGVEHWRRNRGRCMGAIYWQLNDIWPVASWSSVDYFGRWKALHYSAKRFFAPVMISCEEIGEYTSRAWVTAQPSPIETSIRLNVTNESMEDIQGEVFWALRDEKGREIESGSTRLTVAAFSAEWLDKKIFRDIDCRRNYVSYRFDVKGQTVSEGTCLFTLPKHFFFEDPRLSARVEGREIVVTAESYARCVEISSPTSDFVLSDNFFDMNAGEKRVQILEGEPKDLCLRSVYNIR